MKIWWTLEDIMDIWTYDGHMKILWKHENMIDTWKYDGHMKIWWTHEHMIDTTVQIEVRRRHDNYINSGCFFLRTAASTDGLSFASYFLDFISSFFCDQLFLVCTHSPIDNKIMRYQMKLLMNLSLLQVDINSWIRLNSRALQHWKTKLIILC